MTFAVLIENSSEILADFPEISLVYIFGSQVTGKVGPLSDFDLGILVSNPAEGFVVAARFQHALVQLLHTERVDVVLLNRAPIELAYQVIATGKLIFQQDIDTRVEFEAGVMGKYGDYLPVLLFFNDQILKGGNHDQRIQRDRDALGRTLRTLGTS
jgi:uncharacterized protein